MFVNETLKEHLEKSSTIKSSSAVIAEWNMNFPDNISKIGNYRYRPLDGVSSKYGLIQGSYDPLDAGRFYTGATDADVVLDGGVDSSDNPILFVNKKDKEKLLFSLEDCFGRFRPRSGINKIRYGITSFVHHSNPDMASRPRYYMAHKDDNFKYWTSYRTEDGAEYGVSNKTSNLQNYIDDAAPFVVYKESVPTNKIIVKMQTNVGNIALGSFVSSAGVTSDPLYGEENKTVPQRWRIQYLENNSWVDAKVFDSTSKRPDGSPVIGSDGYVELTYGLIIPEQYSSNFIDNGIIGSTFALPLESSPGNAFLVQSDAESVGTYYVWNNDGYDTFIPTYGWYLTSQTATQTGGFVTELANPLYYRQTPTSAVAYREFKYLSGLRIVVDTMTKKNASFDLIELSPRLAADISDITSKFSVTKPASDLGVSGLPVGQLLAGTGALDIFDTEMVFNDNNIFSIVGKYLNRNLQIKLYEVISDVEGSTYYVPIKTMYSEKFPSVSSDSRSVSLELRDLYFYFESLQAPEILIPDVSLSYAVSLLLDSVGFSNYMFKRNEGERDMVIPFFYVGPNQSVAEVLQKLAVSTQTTMFFDEYNNFVCMSKGYIMPSEKDRGVDFILYGTSDSVEEGQIKNKATNPYLSNIISISSRNKNVFNDGKISYTSRYIQKTQASIKQTYLNDRYKTWIYRPSILWEVTASETTKSQNEQSSTSESYALAAIPLNSDLSASIPSVTNHQIVNNIIDLGEGVYWLGRYSGYLYSSGEIIKFDAMEYSVSGQPSNVWITSTQDYQNYFSKIPFNGKMYPTGRVRIYSEPNYETIEGITRMLNGAVAKHGRGQFGTPVVTHSAGINPYWKDNANVRGCAMVSDHLFSGLAVPSSLSTNAAGKTTGTTVNNDRAKKSLRSDLIKNFLSSSFASELSKNSSSSIESQTVQSSALVFEGPTFETNESPINFVSYVHKKVSSPNSLYKHFGTRMRVIGKIENNEKAVQSASGSMSFYKADSSSPELANLLSGGSGGLAVLLNPETNIGYYYEIIALDGAVASAFSDNNSTESTANPIFNVVFYKIQSDSSGNAIPVKLFGGLTNILVDGGNFAGQERVFAQDVQTVYDIAVEYENIGSKRKFYLYLNDTQIATVFDDSPLPEYDSMALFVRGSSRCMFENIYAIGSNYSQNAGALLGPVASPVFGKAGVSINEAFTKYALSGIIQSTYLSGISSAETPKYNMYFDEFGTIMREASYFNIKYDKAYPALYSKIEPTFNRLRGYTVSGYVGGSYGAEFLVFNASNTTLRLSEQTGNHLRIQGIAFTQNSQNEFTVDDYFGKVGDLSNPQIQSNNSVGSLIKNKSMYEDIKYSRMSYGKNEFNLSLDYLQSRDSAYELMGWLTEKIMKPRKSVGVKIFANPMIQLGDIVKIDYVADGVNQVASNNDRFVVYNIEYSKDVGGPEMTIYLSEV
jgi:hypothetical protein